MNLRVTNQSLVRSSLASIRQATQNILVSQEQLATGRKVNRPSDAPLDAAHAQRLHARTAKLAQYRRSLEHAQAEVEFASATLIEINDTFIQAREIAVRAASSTSLARDRATMADEVDDLLEGLISRANATFNGHYVFAGAANDTAPFALESGGMGQSECVAYRGDDAHIELAVGPGLLIATNEPGSAVFVGQRPSETSAFEALIELRDLLRDPDALGEGEIVSRISDHISAISQAHERVTDGAIRLGWRSAQLEASRVSLENAELADQELLSELEDADFAAAAARLYGQELALEAALLVSRRMLGHTLLEYL